MINLSWGIWELWDCSHFPVCYQSCAIPSLNQHTLLHKKNMSVVGQNKLQEGTSVDKWPKTLEQWNSQSMTCSLRHLSRAGGGGEGCKILGVTSWLLDYFTWFSVWGLDQIPLRPTEIFLEISVRTESTSVNFVNNRSTEIIRHMVYITNILVSTSLVLAFKEVFS